MSTDTTAAVLYMAEAAAADLDRALAALIAEATAMRDRLAEGLTPMHGAATYSPVFGHSAQRVEGAAQRLATLREVAAPAGVEGGQWLAAIAGGAAKA